MTIQMMGIVPMIKTCALSVENVEEMANYCTDAYGARCEHTLSPVVRNHLRAIHVICVQRERQKYLTML